MNELFTQVLNNVIILAIALLIVSLPQKGFFWKFIRVKISFGKLIIVKIRAINRDFFKVGHIAEGFLIYKVDRHNHKRVAISDKSVFYRVLGTNWVDFDEEKNCLAKADYSSLEGFDAIKFSDLLKRALYKPQISDDTVNFRILMVMVGIAIVGIAIAVFFLYNMYNEVGIMQGAIATLQQKGTVVAASGL